MLYNDVCWDILQKRRQKHKSIQIFRMKNNLWPEYLTSLVPFDVGDRNPYNLRNANNIQLIHSRTTLYLTHFFPRQSGYGMTFHLIYDITYQLIHSKRIQTEALYLQIPCFFYGGGKSQILHTLLCLKCNSLNNHLFKTIIVDSSNCVCGECESIIIYLNVLFIITCV